MTIPWKLKGKKFIVTGASRGIGLAISKHFYELGAKVSGWDINTEDIVRLWCGHVFHSDCVIPWLLKQNTCPLCRYELPSNNPGYELKRRVETYDDHGMYHVMT